MIFQQGWLLCDGERYEQGLRYVQRAVAKVISRCRPF